MRMIKSYKIDEQLVSRETQINDGCASAQCKRIVIRLPEVPEKVLSTSDLRQSNVCQYLLWKALNGLSSFLSKAADGVDSQNSFKSGLKLRALLLTVQSQSQIRFQVISHYELSYCSNNRLQMKVGLLRQKACPECLADGQRAVLRPVMVFPCFLIPQMSKLSVQILRLCIELTYKTFLCSCQQCIRKKKGGFS